jgi:hypothetical protein
VSVSRAQRGIPARGILTCLIAVLAVCGRPEARHEIAEWRLGSDATLAIGGDGSTQTEFLNVSDTWRLPGGAIAVANAGSNELRVFDASGKYLHAFGRNGDGPGEFRQIAWSGHAGDTAFVWDAAHLRITSVLLGDAPHLLKTIPVSIEGDSGREAIIAGRLTDGRWLVHGMTRPTEFSSGVHRLRGFAGVLGSGGSGTVQWLGEAPDIALFIYNPSGSQKMVMVEPAAFSPFFMTTVSGSSIWFGDTAADTLLRVDVATGAKETARLPDPPVPLPHELLELTRTEALASTKDSTARALANEKFRGPNLPEHLPSYEDMLAGMDGEVWLRMIGAKRDAPVQYLVLSPRGDTLARVSVPAAFMVMDVGRDYVMGVHRDGDGVETIRVYSLAR